MGRLPRTAGNLFINTMREEVNSFRKLIGNVPQEDVMMTEMTVRENILYSARCRLPSSWSTPEINRYVDAVIDVLDLRSVHNNLCGNQISGGQRKRVNIGMELVSIPVCLFLDEPTSGLDCT
jgi:ABC-type multidrug transport system ATPase subunit